MTFRIRPAVPGRRAVRSALVVAAALVSSLSLACARTSAQYPSKPVTLVVWTSAGSSSDQYGRTLASVTEKALGQSIVVVNKPGGAGLTALKYIKGEPADGYAILANTASLVTVLNSQNAGDVNLDDFEYIARVQLDPNVLAVPANSPYKTIDAFIEAAKKDPGKLKVAGFETGGYHNVTFQKVMNRGGFNVTWVPYKGSGEAVTAAMGEHVDAVFANPQAMKGGFQSNRLIPLATTAGERIPDLKEVPTFKEKGIDVNDYQWRGLMARKGTPKQAMDALTAAIQKGVQEPEWKAYMQSSQLLDGFLAGDAYRAQVQKEFEEAKQIMAQLGL